jgi:hypothetical protein
MIQRRQTLFLFQLVILGLALMFVPVVYAVTGRGEIPVYLVTIEDAELRSTPGHVAAVYLNFGALILASATVFLYRRLALQLKICYVLAALWLILTLMIAFCPFVDSGDKPVVVEVNYFAVPMGALGILASVMAGRFIKRDIEVLKSADRIR